METADKGAGRSGVGAGWLARRSLAVRLFVATSAVTIIVMVVITAIAAIIAVTLVMQGWLSTLFAGHS